MIDTGFKPDDKGFPVARAPKPGCRQDEDVACSVAVLFSRKPVARSNAFAVSMKDQGVLSIC